MEDLPHAIRLPAKEKVALLCMEPVEMKDFYHPAFLRQFDRVISWRRNIQHPHLESRWVPYPLFYGIRFNRKRQPNAWATFTKMAADEGWKSRPRARVCSFLVSPKNLCPTHHKRIGLMQHLRGHVRDLAVYGFEKHSDKETALDDFAASVVIENHNLEDGFTEKIQDCFLAGAHPFYWGCRNLESYFPLESFTRIPLEDPPRCLEIIQAAIQQKIWENNLGARQEARKRVLYQYNLYPALQQLGPELANHAPSAETRPGRWLWPEWFFRDHGPRWLPRVFLSLLRKSTARPHGEAATTLEIS